MAQHRNSVAISIKATEHHPVLQQCITDPSVRVMIFCSAGNTGTQDISFPHQSELKVNGGDIKANLRGLKNKPGSTRPVDITDSLRLKPISYANNVEFTYALTQKVSRKRSGVWDMVEDEDCDINRTRDLANSFCRDSTSPCMFAKRPPWKIWWERSPRRSPRTRSSQRVRERIRHHMWVVKC